MKKRVSFNQLKSQSCIKKINHIHSTDESELGCPRKLKTSQTDRYLWDTRLSHYLREKNYRNAKKFKLF